MALAQIYHNTVVKLLLAIVPSGLSRSCGEFPSHLAHVLVGQRSLLAIGWRLQFLPHLSVKSLLVTEQLDPSLAAAAQRESASKDGRPSLITWSAGDMVSLLLLTSDDANRLQCAVHQLRKSVIPESETLGGLLDWQLRFSRAFLHF